MVRQLQFSSPPHRKPPKPPPPPFYPPPPFTDPYVQLTYILINISCINKDYDKSLRVIYDMSQYNFIEYIYDLSTKSKIENIYNCVSNKLDSIITPLNITIYKHSDNFNSFLETSSYYDLRLIQFPINNITLYSKVITTFSSGEEFIVIICFALFLVSVCFILIVSCCCSICCCRSYKIHNQKIDS